MLRVPKLPSRWASLLVMVGAAMVLAACGAREAPQTMFAPSGSNSREIYDLFWPIFWMAIAVFVVVEGFLIYSIMRYRRRTSDGIPLQIHGNTVVEIAWTIVPAIIVLVIAVLTFRTQALIERPAEEEPVRVEVIGHQWWWEFRYPDYDNLITANELHLPADRDVELLLTSSDVIHSFWVPRLAGKRDAIPNHVNRLITRPVAEDRMLLRGQCAEFCGKTHAMMGFYVVVDSQDQFDAWVERQLQEAVVPEGVEQAVAQSNEVAQAGQSDQLQQASPEASPETAATPDAVASPDLTQTPVGEGTFEATAVVVEQEAEELQATAEAETTVQPTSLEAYGYQLFAEKGCVGCHAISGYPGAVARRGPDLTHVGSREHIVAGWLLNTPENMARWLRDPDEVKPENLMALQIQRGTLNEEEIEALTAYLMSLE